MFTELEFSKEFTDPLGLRPAALRGLRQMVVLAGPNGAGKTRYLQIVEDIANAATPEPQKAVAAATALVTGHPRPPWADLSSHQARQLVRSTVEQWEQIKVIPLRYTLVRYDDHPYLQSSADIYDHAEANKKGGFASALAGIQAYLYSVAKVLWDAGDPRMVKQPGFQEELESAKAFNRILRVLLSTEVSVDITHGRDIVTFLAGRRFDPKELSNGELVLMGWAIVLHRQKEWLRGACVLIDEPENHLHPDVCIRALDALRYDILGPEGQIWLATHSVPLIAHAGIESVHLVDNGGIKYAGNKIEEVLDRLLGGQEGRTKLRTLMADADEIAFDTFAAQCLLTPGVASAQESDPQQVQMVKAAKKLGAGKENIRILDFAAGRGRLAAALRDAGQVANRRFTYYAFQDPRFSDPSDRRECVEHIRSLEQPGDPESYLVGTLEGFTVHDAERMDLAVMCNVLHEIPVGDWQHVFERIHDVLVDDGQLVILEDQTPSVGELPHADGYVILNELALQHLFDSKDAVLRLSMEKDGRLTAFAVPRVFLKRVTPQTLGRALASVKRMAEEQIRFIRNKRRDQRSFQDGRLHAHFTLLYANAQLASRQFSDPDAQAN